MSHSPPQANAHSQSRFCATLQSGAAAPHSKTQCAKNALTRRPRLECGSALPLFNFESRRGRYTPRLKRNRYSSNRIIAPTIDMIQPAT
jgi:hypothetical protein